MIAKLIIAIALSSFLLPISSQAQDASQRSSLIAIPPRRLPPPPGEGWVWVPPTYRTVYDRVWSEAVYQTITENVWVPDQYGWRTVYCWEDGHYVQHQEWVLITPGHYDTCMRRILVSPGGWSYVPRQELLTPGHWEWRGPTPPPPPFPPHPAPVPPPFPPSTRPPELQPFSPLWEWPADSKPEVKK